MTPDEIDELARYMPRMLPNYPGPPGLTPLRRSPKRQCEDGNDAVAEMTHYGAVAHAVWLEASYSNWHRLSLEPEGPMRRRAFVDVFGARWLAEQYARAKNDL